MEKLLAVYVNKNLRISGRRLEADKEYTMENEMALHLQSIGAVNVLGFADDLIDSGEYVIDDPRVPPVVEPPPVLETAALPPKETATLPKKSNKKAKKNVIPPLPVSDSPSSGN